MSFVGLLGLVEEEGKVGEDVLLSPPRERSKIRSFFSTPPVARTWGFGWMGKATARQMCECGRVCRHSPECVSQTLLYFVSTSALNEDLVVAYAEKSAAAVAAMFASADSRDCHTAPLWPRKVPILLMSVY